METAQYSAGAEGRTEALPFAPASIVPGLVSTVIPVFNRGWMAGDAVRSVLAQTYRPIEIILVDDGSTDDTWDRLREWEHAQPEIVRAVRRENGGPGLARETGRRLARGEFIQYLDSDDLLLPRKFEAQVAALISHPECDIAYGQSRLIGADGAKLREPSKWTGRSFERLFPALLVDRWWHTHTPLYRRELCDRIGPWRASRPEDWDYDARAGALGARLVFVPETLSCQRYHEGHRITGAAVESYLPQEAEFLPRLLDCARRAGVPCDAPEMRHFARWAFALARRVGAMGLSAAADALLGLSAKAGGETRGGRMVRRLARAVGWRAAGRLCLLLERAPFRRRSKSGLSPSWIEDARALWQAQDSRVP